MTLHADMHEGLRKHFLLTILEKQTEKNTMAAHLQPSSSISTACAKYLMQLKGLLPFERTWAREEWGAGSKGPHVIAVKTQLSRTPVLPPATA